MSEIARPVARMQDLVVEEGIRHFRHLFRNRAAYLPPPVHGSYLKDAAFRIEVWGVFARRKRR